MEKYLQSLNYVKDQHTNTTFILRHKFVKELEVIRNYENSWYFKVKEFFKDKKFIVNYKRNTHVLLLSPFFLLA